MKIEVRCDCGAAECKEWAMIELQGSLELQDAQQQLQNLAIGSLCRHAKETYTFTVGYHELEGRVMPLKKPLLVLRKVVLDEMDTDQVQPAAPKSKLEVVGVIRQKILFKTRPMALISKPEPKKKNF